MPNLSQFFFLVSILLPYGIIVYWTDINRCMWSRILCGLVASGTAAGS